jgi:hypothetical protein
MQPNVQKRQIRHGNEFERHINNRFRFTACYHLAVIRKPTLDAVVQTAPQRSGASHEAEEALLTSGCELTLEELISLVAWPLEPFTDEDWTPAETRSSPRTNRKPSSSRKP